MYYDKCLWFHPHCLYSKKVFSLLSWREQICNWWEIHRSDYDYLCFLMSPLWAPALISDKSVFCSFSPASFSSFRWLFRFVFFSRLCLPSTLKQSCSAPCVPYPLPWFSCSLVNAMRGVSRDDNESIKGDHWAYYSPVSPTRMHPPWRRRLYLPISSMPLGSTHRSAWCIDTVLLLLLLFLTACSERHSAPLLYRTAQYPGFSYLAQGGLGATW